MSVYAFDQDRRVLVAMWPAAVGHRAGVVIGFGVEVSAEQAARLSAELTGVSRALWDTAVRDQDLADRLCPYLMPIPGRARPWPNAVPITKC